MRKTKMMRQVVGIIPLVVLITFALYFVSALIMAASFATTGTSEAETIFQVNITNPGESTVSALGYFVRMSNSNNVEMQISPTSMGSSDTASDTVYAWTNSPSGYKLYLSVLRDADLIVPGTTDTVPGNGLLLDGSDLTHYFGPTSAADLDVNSWGYSLDGTTFSAVPLRGSEDLIKTTNAANELAVLEDESVKRPVYYGAKANMGMVSGDYSNTVLYTAVAEASSNPGGELTIAPTSTTSKITTTPVKIATSLYTNVEDYGEITAYIGTNGNADDVCANVAVDTVLTASEGVLVISCDAPTKPAVYATTSFNVYVNVPKFGKTYSATGAFTYTNDFWTITNMQEMTSDVCAWATTPSVSATGTDTTGAYTGNTAYVPQRTLYDIRDGESYRIRKLADGNCWMTKNLRLGLSTDTALLPSDTDVLEDWTPENSTQTSTGINWILENKARSMYANTGGYYNWYAATAGTGTIDLVNATAPSSICPANWKLPESINTEKSWEHLLTEAYTFGWGGAVRRFPIETEQNGMYQKTEIGSPSGGYYWSSQAHPDDATAAGNGLLLREQDKKQYGFNVRCVAK